MAGVVIHTNSIPGRARAHPSVVVSSPTPPNLPGASAPGRQPRTAPVSAAIRGEMPRRLLIRSAHPRSWSHRAGKGRRGGSGIGRREEDHMGVWASEAASSNRREACSDLLRGRAASDGRVYARAVVLAACDGWDWEFFCGAVASVFLGRPGEEDDPGRLRRQPTASMRCREVREGGCGQPGTIMIRG